MTPCLFFASSTEKVLRCRSFLLIANLEYGLPTWDSATIDLLSFSFSRIFSPSLGGLLSVSGARVVSDKRFRQPALIIRIISPFLTISIVGIGKLP